MKIKPQEKKADVFKDLTPLEKQTRRGAIILAFVGVFAWAVKILLF